MWRAVSALLRKELRLELRTFQVVPAMALFSITTLVVFHFSLQKDRHSECYRLRAMTMRWTSLVPS